MADTSLPISSSPCSRSWPASPGGVPHRRAETASALGGDHLGSGRHQQVLRFFPPSRLCAPVPGSLVAAERALRTRASRALPGRGDRHLRSGHCRGLRPGSQAARASNSENESRATGGQDALRRGEQKHRHRERDCLGRPQPGLAGSFVLRCGPLPRARSWPGCGSRVLAGSFCWFRCCSTSPRARPAASTSVCAISCRSILFYSRCWGLVCTNRGGDSWSGCR